MGTGSSNSNKESAVGGGDHFNAILRAPKLVKSKRSDDNSKGKSKEVNVADPSELSSSNIVLHPSAAVLKQLQWHVVWDVFLSSALDSFALSSSELTNLLLDSLAESLGSGSGSSNDFGPVDEAATVKNAAELLTAGKENIKKYVELLTELMDKEHVKAIDTLSVISSILLLSSLPVERKIDQLFIWITLSDQKEREFNFEEFFIALSSFEAGLSHAFGRPAGSEPFIRAVAMNWFALADPNHRGANDASVLITNSQFFDFCTNRQNSVRRLLELLGSSKLPAAASAVGALDDVALKVAEKTKAGESTDAMLLAGPHGGDEFMANPAWKKTAEKMVPQWAQQKKPTDAAPTATLSLEWVHGYRGFDSRNNIAYVNGGPGVDSSRVVFTAAALSIVQDCEARKQSYFGEHSDDIICMAVHQPAGYVSNSASDWGTVLMATGEVGKEPAIHLYTWTNDAAKGDHFTPLGCCVGFHKKGVAQLAFSPCGRFLFSVGIEYSVAVYDSNAGSPKLCKMLGSAQGPKGTPLHCVGLSAPSGNASVFVTVGEKHAQVWTVNNGAPTGEPAKLDKFKRDTILSVTRGKNGTAVLGTSEGDLVLLHKIDVVEKATVKEAHSKGVSAIWSTPDGEFILSGGRDGIVKIWNCNGAALVVIGAVEMKGHVGTKCPSIRAVCLAPGSKKLLVGTQTCEILEARLQSPSDQATFLSSPVAPGDVKYSSVINGHFKDEVWGLAVRPQCKLVANGQRAVNDEEQFATVGDDGYLRIWGVRSRKSLFELDLSADNEGNDPAVARCCAFSPDGVFLAIGFGGGSKARRGGGPDKWAGVVRVYRVETSAATGGIELTKISEWKEGKQALSAIHFSPDGATLGVGSRDNSIYLYSVAQQFKKKAKFSKHTAGINQFDFSACGKYIQSCCSSYEILYSDATNGSQITKASEVLLEESWDTWTCTLGWSTIGIWKGTMDGSDVNSCHRSPSGTLLAISDDFGKVTLYRYPAVQLTAQGVPHVGHSSHVTTVRWLSLYDTDKASDDYLISVGGEDKCVFQWKCSSSKSRPTGSTSSTTGAAATEFSATEDAFSAPSGGDEFTAVKAWLGAIVTPTAFATPDPAKASPYLASLGELASLHQNLEKNRTESIYQSLAQSCKLVNSRMAESGVINSTPPSNDDLEIEWVHGIRSFDSRNNVFYLPTTTSSRRLIYPAAALGVQLTLESEGEGLQARQKYFRGHTDDIMACAVHCHPSAPETVLVATGSVGPTDVFVWCGNSLAVLSTFSTKQKTVHHLTFSPDGRLLVSVAEDKSVCVSDWKSQRVMANVKGEPAVTHHIAAGAQQGNIFNFVTLGEKHILYWTMDGRNLTNAKISTATYKKDKQDKDMPEKCGNQNYFCVAAVHGKFIIGAEDGCLYITSHDMKTVERGFLHHVEAQNGSDAKKELDKLINKKKGCVLSLFSDDSRNLLISGAQDGSIVLWDTAEMAGKAELPPGLRPVPKHFFSLVNASTPTGILVPNLLAKHIHGLSLSSAPSGSELKLAVATRGCELIEIRLAKDSLAPVNLQADILVRGHCNDELWGLATHPLKPEYCTVGDDKTLRFFSVITHRQLACESLGEMARAVCYSPEAPHVLAVGFGGRVGKGKEKGGGIVRLYNSYNSVKPAEIKQLAEASNAKEWISDVKFSSDGRTVAAGAHDCKIYIYDVTVSSAEDVPVTGSLKLRCTFAKHNSVINHLDFSADSRFMQSTCSAYELLFSDLSSGKQVTKASELKDVKWDTWTCPLGWPVQGIWSGGEDGSDINAVCRSNSGHLLASTDDFGKVNLFRYPCVEEKAQRSAFTGHSSHVMNCKWTVVYKTKVGDECLITVGGNDKCVIQWRHTMSESQGGASGSSSSGGGGGASAAVGKHGEEKPSAAAETAASGEFGFGAPSGGDECGAVKPWLGAIKTPKHPPAINPKPPTESFQRTWVHGFCSGRSAANTPVSNNLFYSDATDNSFFYNAAALGIKYSVLDGAPGGVKGRQTYFTGHNDDILCLAISSDRRFIATGQTASKKSKGKADLCVWSAADCTLLSRMAGCHQRGINNVSFSPQGNMLLSVGMDDSNTHNLWTDAGGGWSRASLTASEKGEQSQVLFTKWAHEKSGHDFQFVSGTEKTVQFWKFEGGKLSKKSGRLGSFKAAPQICGANVQCKDGWKLCVGTAKGDIFVYGKDKEVISSIPGAHKGGVYSLCEGGVHCSFLVSGGRDGFVRIFNNALQPICQFDVMMRKATARVPGESAVKEGEGGEEEEADGDGNNLDVVPVDGCVAALDVRPLFAETDRQLRILVGTRGGDILEITSEDKHNTKGAGAAADGQVQDPRNLDLSGAAIAVHLHSHTQGELWGLAPHPTNPDLVATVGDDSTLRIWSIKEYTSVCTVPLYWPARSVGWNPTGTVLAVGFHEALKGGGKKRKAKKGDKGKDSGDSPKTHKGAVHLYSFHTTGHNQHQCVKRADGCMSAAWIGEVKFSPDGKLLAAGSHDKHLYIFRIPDVGDMSNTEVEWPEWSKCLEKEAINFNKHSSAVLHVDFTLDLKFIQSTCQAGELLFSDPNTGKQETSATKMAEYHSILAEEESEGGPHMWASQTCILGWSVQGVMKSDMGVGDINSVDRIGGKANLLASADDNGEVNVYRYPVVDEKAQAVTLLGHSSHVTNVRWSADGEYLLSVGGNDKCLFIWKKHEA